MSLHIGLVNLEPAILKDVDLQRIAHSIQRQLRQDVAPIWDGACTGAVVELIPPGDAAKYPGILAYCMDSIPNAPDGVLAEHSVGPDGRPAIWASAKVALRYGSELSEDLSHEAIELVGDPDCVRTWVMRHCPGRPAEEAIGAYELCDPTQRAYRDADGVSLADFVYPGYFSGIGPTRHMEAVAALHDGARLTLQGVLDTGYLSYAELRSPIAWAQVFGDHPKARRSLQRMAHGLGSRVQRRGDPRPDLGEGEG